MNQLSKKPVLLLILLFILSATADATESIDEFLKRLPLENIKILEREAFYSNIYEVQFEQPLDHENPAAGSFTQRLYISHVDESQPVVLVTEGYSAGYYYTSEPAYMLKCNQIIAEHRYFGESVPDSVQWQYLTTYQAASDHHRIIANFREFYTDQWITTGISKGGQSVMFHSYYYPDDVDARIPYVAPLNKELEDTRIYTFLEKVGPKVCRRQIKKFQKHLLKNQEELLPEFKTFSDKKNYTYNQVGGIEKAFEYCVLEYSFAFWQWGYARCSEIPGRHEKPDKIIAHIYSVAGFDYFADEFINEYRPFFYQAYTEMGYYGYNLQDFNPHLRHATESGFKFTLPADVEVSFNNKILLEVDDYIRNRAGNFIFIYGEYDTWSATAVELSGNTNSRVFYKEKGSHRTRIKNMPQEQQDEIYVVLNEFLKR